MKKERKSLYIGVALFMAGIIVSGFVSDFVMRNTNENSEDVVDVTVEEEAVDKVYEVNYEKETEKAVQPASTPAVVEEPKEPEEEPFLFTAPINGEILLPYSGDKLVFSETLQDYRRHGGVDIKSHLLQKVSAVERGVVKEVKNDRFLGITIVIDHQNGFESVYSNLSTENMVKVGDNVEKGMIISGIGDTAISESVGEAHLHFELYKDGKAVNPEEYISF